MDTYPHSDLKKIIFKGLFWVSLTSMLLHIIQLFVKIYLARLLTPADFGIMAIAISIISFANLFHDLGLGHALIQRKTKVQESFNTTFCFVFIFSIIFMLCLIIISTPLTTTFKDERISVLITIVAFSMPFASILIPYTSYLSKNLLFFKGFIAETSSIIIGNSLTVYLAYTGWGYISLGIGFLTGTVSYAILLFFLVSWRPSFSFDWTIFKELISYGKYLFFVNIATILLTQGDNFFVGKIINTETLGYYSIAYTFATLPAINSVYIISKVMFPTFARLQNNMQKLQNSFLKSILLVSSVVFPVIFGTILLSPFLFTLFLGEKWSPAHVPLIILSFLALFRSIMVVPSFFLEGTGHAKKNAHLIIFAVILFLIGVGPATYFFGVVGTGAYMTFIYFLTLQCYLFSISNILNTNITQIFKQFVSPILATSIMFLTGKLILIFNNQKSFFTFFLIILISILIYSLVLFLLNKKAVYELKNLFWTAFNKS